MSYLVLIKAKIFSLSLGIMLVLLFTPPAMAGPWTQEKGDLYTSYNVEYTYRRKQKLFNGKTKKEGPGKFLLNALYAEYGVSEDLTFSVYLPYEVVTVDDPLEHMDDFGDSRYRLKYRLLNEENDPPIPVSLAVMMEYKTPLSDYESNRESSIGDQQDDIDLRVTVGSFFEVLEKTGYWSLEGGYRWRDRAPSDDIFGSFEIGMFFTEQLGMTVLVEHTDAREGIGLGSDEFKAGIKAMNAPGEKVFKPFSILEEDITTLIVSILYTLPGGIDFTIFGGKTIKVSNAAIENYTGMSFGYQFR